VIQTALLVAIALMAAKPAQTLQLQPSTPSNCLLSATQDIAADYRADVLEELEMGAGAAVFVLGYQLLCSPVLWR